MPRFFKLACHQLVASLAEFIAALQSEALEWAGMQAMKEKV
jgi:hypothetical protein